MSGCGKWLWGVDARSGCGEWLWLVSVSCGQVVSGNCSKYISRNFGSFVSVSCDQFVIVSCVQFVSVNCDKFVSNFKLVLQQCCQSKQRDYKSFSAMHHCALHLRSLIISGS